MWVSLITAILSFCCVAFQGYQGFKKDNPDFHIIPVRQVEPVNNRYVSYRGEYPYSYHYDTQTGLWWRFNVTNNIWEYAVKN